MTWNEWHPTAGIEGVSARFDPDGSLRESGGIEVQVNFTEARDYVYDEEDARQDEGEDVMDAGDIVDTEYRNGAYARLRFDVDDGRAEFSQFKDVSTGRSTSNWDGIDFLKTLWAACEVVGTLPGVESVTRPGETIQKHLDAGAEAEVYRA